MTSSVQIDKSIEIEGPPPLFPVLLGLGMPCSSGARVLELLSGPWQIFCPRALLARPIRGSD